MFVYYTDNIVMASEEHKQLASYLKEVHSSLRKSSSIMGAEEAWRKHCQNTDVLHTYARSMEMLATKHWEENCSNATSPATSRIKWSADICYDYFIKKSYMNHRQKEKDIGSKINIILQPNECFDAPVKLIDVGSCYNPFQIYDFMEVLAVDLYPANKSVLQCDFLDVSVGPNLIIEQNKLQQIERDSFDIVAFCFLLEYLPSSELRIKACEKAYSILKPEGLLMINTPDSKHVNANCKLMKCWRYTLAHIGFTRIKYEKMKHMHCMAFRKCLNKDIGVRWADIHKESYMEYCLNIPQDFQYGQKKTCNIPSNIEVSCEDFKELPFDNLD